MIPFIYVLMTHKSQASYTHILRHIHEDLWALDAMMFMTDYEIAMRNALRSIFPDADHRCCWFHFCQVFYIFFFILFFSMGLCLCVDFISIRP